MHEWILHRRFTPYCCILALSLVRVSRKNNRFILSRQNFILQKRQIYHRGLHDCQPRETFSRDRRAGERCEAGFGRGGGAGGDIPRIKIPCISNGESELFMSYICEYN